MEGRNRENISVNLQLNIICGFCYYLIQKNPARSRIKVFKYTSAYSLIVIRLNWYKILLQK